MRYRKTTGEGTWDWDGVGWFCYKENLESGTSVDLNLTEAGFDGQCLNADQHEWGTYTYDFMVLEFRDGIPENSNDWTEGNADDFQFLKRYRDDYHLWVPAKLPPPDDDEPGHDAWSQILESGEEELRGYYCLESDWGAKEAQVPRGEDVLIVVVDPELRDKSTTSGPGKVGDTGPEYGTEDADEDGKLDGLPLYTFQDSDPGGTWRAIFTANDNAGIRSPNWRTHTPVRMITANADPAGSLPIVYITGTHAGFEWYGAWCKAGRGNAKTRYEHPSRRTVFEVVGEGMDGNQKPMKIRAGVNGGFFGTSGEHVLVGWVGVGTPRAWVGYDCSRRRWGFGFERSGATWSRTIALDTPRGDKFKPNSRVEAHRWGLTAVGCLMASGSPKIAGDSPGFPNANTRDARTCVGWTACGDFFLVSCNGNDQATPPEGWGWQDMVSFFADQHAGLRYVVSRTYRYDPEITGAMALDGGSSTSFRYLRVGPKGKEQDEEFSTAKARVRSIVLGYAP